MKRNMLFVALASALSLSAYAHDQSNKQSSQSEQTQQQSANSEVVKQAQQKLSDSGKDVTVDGQIGPKTQAALKEFQQEKGLQASGQLDPQTIAALDINEGGSSASGGTSSPQSEQSGSGGSSDASGDTSGSK